MKEYQFFQDFEGLQDLSNGHAPKRFTYVEVVLLTEQELPDEFKALTTYWKFVDTRFYRIGKAVVLRSLTGDEYALIGKQKTKFINISSEVIQR